MTELTPQQEGWERSFDEEMFTIKKVDINDDHSCQAWNSSWDDEGMIANNVTFFLKDAPDLKAFIARIEAAAYQRAIREVEEGLPKEVSAELPRGHVSAEDAFDSGEAWGRNRYRTEVLTLLANKRTS